MGIDVFFTECPRDALQGLKSFVPTELKVKYIKSLLSCGFQAIDFCSFVSPKSIPQFSDAEILCNTIEKDLPAQFPQCIAIVGNKQGAERTGPYFWISHLGYPHSTSPTFLQRNINASYDESLKRLDEIRNIGQKYQKKIIVYLSMAFGNPYNDPWNYDLVFREVEQLVRHGFSIIMLSDTIGCGTPEITSFLFSNVYNLFPNEIIGAHFHVTPRNMAHIVEAAWEAGCRRFDGVLKGYGGCPMAADKLTGNLPTEFFIDFLERKNKKLSINYQALREAQRIADEIFAQYS